jgi:hypothetical protein
MQRLSADIELYIRALEEYEGPDGWVQGSRHGTWMTREQVVEFYAEYLGLLRKYSHAEESAPPDARPVAIRFLVIPRPEPPLDGPAPA